MKSALAQLVSLLASLSLAAPAHELRAEPTDLPRLVVYFQTTHDSLGRPISMLPLIQAQGIALTHLIVCSLHVNVNDEIHLNDFPPDNSRFRTLWNETTVLKQAGVKIMGMVGGAAPGSFDSSTLDGDSDTFEHYYGQLKDVITNFGLEGMDLDVEQGMSQAGITRLVGRLGADFGPDFLVTLAPVASALRNGSNLSGFSYNALEAAQGPTISFYNTQFYSGFGSMASTSDFDNIVRNGYKPADIVAGQLTAPANGGGFLPTSVLNSTIIRLRDKYGTIGGVMGWEYFNSQPGGTAAPWEWAQIVTEILRPDGVPELTITREHAERLQTAYTESMRAAQESESLTELKPTVDYMAMVNA